MKFFKKIKSFFVDDRHEEDEYYEDYYVEDEINEPVERPVAQRHRPTTQAVEQQDKSKFRFPLIDDQPQSPVETYEEPMKERKKSAVFYDVEQDTGVKLPAHLPQQSLVYDVEVSNIAELLEKRNKSHGNRSIVRYEQSTLRPRSKGPVTAAEKQFLTANPQREDVASPVVNREPTKMSKGKRFVPTQVPSPIHGFNKPKPIEELLPDLERKQQEAKLVAEGQSEVLEVKQDQVEDRAADLNVTQIEEQAKAKEPYITTQAEQLEQLTNIPNVEAQNMEQVTQQTEVVMEEQNELKAAVDSEVYKNQEQPELAAKEENSFIAQADKQEATLNGEQRLQELAVQHLTIENSTVHIEQLRVEQPAPIVQPTINIEANPAPTSNQVEVPNEETKPTVEIEEVQQPAETVQDDDKLALQANSSSTKGTRLPFNVIMLDSDKKKLQKPLAAYGVTPSPAFPITDWNGNVIATPAVEQAETQEDALATSHEKMINAEEDTVNQQEQGGSPFLSEELLIAELAAEVQPSFQLETAEATMESEASVVTLVKEQEPVLLDEEMVEEQVHVQQTEPLPPSERITQPNELVEEAQFQTELETLNEKVIQESEQNVSDSQAAIEPIEEASQQLEEQSVQPIEENVVEEKATEQVANPAPQLQNATEQLVTTVPTSEVTNVAGSVTETTAMDSSVATAAPIEVNTPPIEVAPSAPIEPTQLYEAYEKPPMDFLLPAEERTEDWAWLDEQAEYLIAALASHQVQAQIESIEQGPAVTQFEITVAQGTKVSKVRNLSDDIKLALAAKDIRIDAPIPGKRTIGIEIPNRVSRAVRLSEVTNSEHFIESNSPLEAALGLDLSGKPVTLDLRKMPHGLIAGATGSGKSVCINSILVSLLYKADPNELKLMLIDPKMVELAPFNKIPHLVSPVITDVKAATAALKWAVEEMERRYQLFMHAGVRDLTRYNQQAENARQFAQKLPYILIVIDELADLMMMAPADVEEAICRIAQKARACGIHLIVATQRPSVDVITGLIKSNIPTRIAFAVSSAIDSRTILDTQGAERLLGRGDMLYLGNGMQAPIRLQGTFVTDDEIEDIIAYVRNQGEPNYLFAQEDLIKRTEMFEEQDELFEEVCRFVHEQGTASTSSVQRHFHIGYNRAARLVDMLEKKGFVSEARGSKPRDVFINESDLEELFR